MGRDERNNIEARRFAQEINARARQTDARDRFNRPLVVGATVLLTPTHPLTYTVEKIDPVLDPRAPAGTIQVTITTVLTTLIAAGVPWPDATIVALPAARPQAEQPPAAETAPDPAQTVERETQGGVVRFPEQPAVPAEPPAIVLTDGDR
jgi:hypothetical protein